MPSKKSDDADEWGEIAPQVPIRKTSKRDHNDGVDDLLSGILGEEEKPKNKVQAKP